MIEVSNLVFAYPGQSTPVFDGFSWRVERGEAWTVIGPSGCGKTTLLYLLAGLRRPDSGRISVGGADVAGRGPCADAALVLQDYGLLPWATVWDNARLGLRVRRPYGRAGDGLGAQAQFWLERLGIAELRSKYPSQLSGGQRQRVALARALAMDPAVLLLDEPFSAVDDLAREDLERLVMRLWADTGVTTVLVTHSIEEAVLLGQRILVLNRPPNRSVTIVENHMAGDISFRAHSEFVAKCLELREQLSDVLQP
jgi:NitT/TauT family transport system ATP-binding protein